MYQKRDLLRIIKQEPISFIFLKISFSVLTNGTYTKQNQVVENNTLDILSDFEMENF